MTHNIRILAHSLCRFMERGLELLYTILYISKNKAISVVMVIVTEVKSSHVMKRHPVSPIGAMLAVSSTNNMKDNPNEAINSPNDKFIMYASKVSMFGYMLISKVKIPVFKTTPDAKRMKDMASMNERKPPYKLPASSLVTVSKPK